MTPEPEPSEQSPQLDDTVLSGIEAVLMIADAPVTAVALAEGLGISEAHAAAACRQLQADYDGTAPGSRRRGFELRMASGGWRIYSRSDFHDLVTDFLTAGQTATLSQAALETLAVIAYRQPVTRARISAIRGVNVDGVVRTLLMRGLIVEAGTEELTGARQFTTTAQFLESLGLDSLDELPDIAPFLPADEDVPAGDDIAFDTDTAADDEPLPAQPPTAHADTAAEAGDATTAEAGDTTTAEAGDAGADPVRQGRAGLRQ